MASNVDQVDRAMHSAQHNLPAKIRSILCTVLTIALLVFDLVEDFIVMCKYWKKDDQKFFWMTFTFVAVPSFSMMVLSLIWYLKDDKDHTASKTAITVRTIFLALQLGPVLRCIETLVYEHRCEKNPHDEELRHRFHQSEYRAHFLRLLEAFLECGPQLVLQLYIIAIEPDSIDYTGYKKNTFRTILVFHLLFSMAEAIVMHNTVLRTVNHNKRNQRPLGVVCQLLWYLNMLWARLTSLALFASFGALFPLYTFLICFVHWVIMLVWILKQSKKCHRSLTSHYLYSASIAVIYIFSFFRVNDETTRVKYACYYVFVFLQSTTMVLVWYFLKPNGNHFWYYDVSLYVYFGNFAAGLFFMMIYYLCLHPSKPYKRSKFYNHEKTNSKISREDATVLNAA